LDFFSARALSVMRAVIQRVSSASVSVEGTVRSSIGQGLLVFLGISAEDTQQDVEWLAGKIPVLRCFEDSDGRMNLSLRDIEGEVLLISQFTLFGTLRKGTRPSFNRAALPAVAIPLYESFIQCLSGQLDKPVGTGVFGADMQIAAHNDGPVTLILDTRNKEF
jgi:D-aminoacyl-tRNA deacylase